MWSFNDGDSKNEKKKKKLNRNLFPTSCKTESLKYANNWNVLITFYWFLLDIIKIYSTIKSMKKLY